MRAVVFDFDGVIVNSEPLHFRGFRDVLAERGVELTEADYYRRYLGYDDRAAFAAIAADSGCVWTEDDLAELVERKALRLERDAPELFPGAAEAVRRLASTHRLAIASGAIRPEITRVLEREGLTRHFTAIASAEDARASKPAPDVYFEALRQLSSAAGAPLAAADCVAIEDSQWGIDAARAAGLRTIGVTHTYHAQALTGTDIVISHLDLVTEELLAELDQTFSVSRRTSLLDV
jgi:HAD superfamily hydrolase (TIGR01509 family)